MAKVSIESNAVLVTLSTTDKILAVHGSLRIPLAHVKRAQVEDESGWQQMFLKLIGTNAPGIKMAGTFYLDGGLAFLDYAGGRACLVLQTTHETYAQVIVQTDRDQDPDALAAEINRRIGST